MSRDTRLDPQPGSSKEQPGSSKEQGKAAGHQLDVGGAATRPVVVVHRGDNRKTAPVALAGVADRVNLGLLPSSEPGWPVAAAVLKPRGGMLHVHGNVFTGDWVAGRDARSNKARDREAAELMARVQLDDEGEGGGARDAAPADADDYVYDLYYQLADDGAGG